MLAELPSELVYEVTSHLARIELLPLTQVNHTLQLQCEPAIYRTISLSSPTHGQLVKFCRTLVSRAQLASYVRELHVDIACGPAGTWLLKPFETLLLRALGMLEELKSLSVVNAPSILPFLSRGNIHFPYLTAFRCRPNLASSSSLDDITNFLNKHSSLEYLAIFPSHLPLSPDMFSRNITPINLASLRTMLSFPSLASLGLISPGSSFNCLQLVWNEDKLDGYHFLSQPIAVLDNYLLSWRYSVLLQTIKSHFLQVHTLKFTFIQSLVHQNEWELFLVNFEQVLPSLNTLQNCSFQNTEPIHVTQDVISQEHVLLSRWSSLSSSLLRVLFPSQVAWSRSSNPLYWSLGSSITIEYHRNLDGSRSATISSHNVEVLKWFFTKAVSKEVGTGSMYAVALGLVGQEGMDEVTKCIEMGKDISGFGVIQRLLQKGYGLQDAELHLAFTDNL
ncbi:hypothetical protein MIND_00593200 [Mycena indigotica]|uniref:F-box domain-containing protein n=1 Tax=Mycena indigotica TaxID=2126181 RepID=A0A8H6W8Z8_9AGAR|nr:uncharacterized protein MIND_00593200 [Mycena indigotica]KAF7303639.1 hypothetical protein MIND_00593200 [Mycena indigotica]